MTWFHRNNEEKTSFLRKVHSKKLNFLSMKFRSVKTYKWTKMINSVANNTYQLLSLLFATYITNVVDYLTKIVLELT